MRLKTILFGLMCLSILFYILWILGYFGLAEMDTVSRQTYALMGNVKLAVAVAFYVAWRVTP